MEDRPRRFSRRLFASLLAFPAMLRRRAVQAAQTGVATPYVVTAEWLKTNLASRELPILVLDFSKLRTYRKRHIAGAVHGWWQDTIERDDPVYGTVLQPENFTDQTKRIKLLESLGIADEHHVIAYDDDRGRWAAHFVWFLRFLGHDRASILDGGLDAWQSDGGETVSDDTDPPTSPTPAVMPRGGYYLTTPELIEQLKGPTMLLVDVRTEEEARDTINDRVPTGRIPGSIQIPWTSSLREGSSLLKPNADLQSLYASSGLTSEQPVVVYGRFGVEASHTWLVLKSIGYLNVAVYDRGWVGWTTESGRPFDAL